MMKIRIDTSRAELIVIACVGGTQEPIGTGFSNHVDPDDNFENPNSYSDGYLCGHGNGDGIGTASNDFRRIFGVDGKGRDGW